MHKHYRLPVAALGLAATLALPACVTINIYFPEAAAEKAADKIIEDVWQLKQEQQQPVAEEPDATEE